MRIEIVDVGPRDGLQNEEKVLSTGLRAQLCGRLAEAGLRRIEAASFVNPKLVPQMAGAEEVFEALDARPEITYAGLVLNERGYERGLAAGARELRYSFGVTESFCARNQNSTVEESVALARRLAARARADGVSFSVTLSVAFGCPFEGRVDPGCVLDLTARVADASPDELVFADTIGVGVPKQVRRLVEGALPLVEKVGCHPHNTRNTGYANALAAVETGATVLDASVGGAGGCPFAPGATGNIATEDLVYLLNGMGYETGVDLEALIEVSRWLSGILGKQLPGQLYRAGSLEMS